MARGSEDDASSSKEEHGRRKQPVYPALPGVSVATALFLGLMTWIAFGPIIDIFASSENERPIAGPPWIDDSAPLLVFTLASVATLGAHIGNREWGMDQMDYQLSQKLLLVLLALETCGSALVIDLFVASIVAKPTKPLLPIIVTLLALSVFYFAHCQTLNWRPLRGTHVEMQLIWARRVLRGLQRPYVSRDADAELTDQPPLFPKFAWYATNTFAHLTVLALLQVAFYFQGSPSERAPLAYLLFVLYIDVLFFVLLTGAIAGSATLPSRRRLAAILINIFMISIAFAIIAASRLSIDGTPATPGRIAAGAQSALLLYVVIMANICMRDHPLGFRVFSALGLASLLNRREQLKYSQRLSELEQKRSQ